MTAESMSSWYAPSHQRKAKQHLQPRLALLTLEPKCMEVGHPLPSRERQRAHSQAFIRGRVGIRSHARPNPCGEGACLSTPDSSCCFVPLSIYASLAQQLFLRFNICTITQVYKICTDSTRVYPLSKFPFTHLLLSAVFCTLCDRPATCKGRRMELSGSWFCLCCKSHPQR